MTSIMTNTSAMAALQTLRSINAELGTTQSRISSGYRVETAADNAAYWSIATTMRSDNKALSTIEDALGLGAAKTDVAYTGLNSAIDVVAEIKVKLVAAKDPGLDKNKINAELTELKNQLRSITESASFSSENWLFNDSATPAGIKNIVASFNRASDGKITVTTLDYNAAQSTLIDTNDASLGLLTKDIDADALDPNTTGTARNYFLIDAGSTTSATGTEITINASTADTVLDDMIRVADNIHASLTDAAANLGAINKRIEMQEQFVANLMDTIETGVGRLVDANMNEESTRLKALQTQQQLGIQSLSIANTNSQNILQLFQQ